jgi:hypothetical protein
MNEHKIDIRTLSQYLSKHNGNLKNALNIEHGLNICLILEVKIKDDEVRVFYNT